MVDQLQTDVQTNLIVDVAGSPRTLDDLSTAVGRTTKRMREVIKQSGYLFLALKRIAIYTAIFTTFASLVKLLGDVVEMETRFAEVSTLVDMRNKEAAASFEAVKRSLLKVSPYLGTTINLTKGLYEIMSAGVTEPREAFKLLVISAKYAKAGLTDLATAASTLTAVMKAYNLRADEMRKKSDALFASVMEGKFHAHELNEAIGKVLPTAAAMGVSIEEVSAALAVMTQRGLDVNEAATALNRMMISFLRPIDKAKKKFQMLGWEWGINAFKATGLIGAMDRLQEASARYSGILPEIFRRQRALRGAFLLQESGLKDLKRLYDKVVYAQGEAGEVARAHEKILKTVGEELKAIGARLQQATAALLKHKEEGAFLVRGLGVIIDRFLKLNLVVSMTALSVIPIALRQLKLLTAALAHHEAIVESLTLKTTALTNAEIARQARSIEAIRSLKHRIGLLRTWIPLLAGLAVTYAVIKTALDAWRASSDRAIASMIKQGNVIRELRERWKLLGAFMKEAGENLDEYTERMKQITFETTIEQIKKMQKAGMSSRKIISDLYKALVIAGRGGAGVYKELKELEKAVRSGDVELEKYRYTLNQLSHVFKITEVSQRAFLEWLIKATMGGKKYEEAVRNAHFTIRDLDNAIQAINQHPIDLARKETYDGLKAMKVALTEVLSPDFDPKLKVILRLLGRDIDKLRKDLLLAKKNIDEAFEIKPVEDFNMMVEDWERTFKAGMDKVMPSVRQLRAMIKALHLAHKEFTDRGGKDIKWFASMNRSNIKLIIDNWDILPEKVKTALLIDLKAIFDKSTDDTEKYAKRVAKAMQWMKDTNTKLLSDLQQFENELNQEKYNDIVTRTEEENILLLAKANAQLQIVKDNHGNIQAAEEEHARILAFLQEKLALAHQVANQRRLLSDLQTMKQTLSHDFDTMQQRLNYARKMYAGFDQYIEQFGKLSEEELERLKVIWEKFWEAVIKGMLAGRTSLDNWIDGLRTAGRSISSFSQSLATLADTLGLTDSWLGRLAGVFGTLGQGLTGVQSGLAAIRSAQKIAADAGKDLFTTLGGIAGKLGVVGAIASTVIGIFGKLFKKKTEAEKLAEAVEGVKAQFKAFGDISDSTAKKFMELQKEVGTVAARLLTLNDRMQDTGVNARNFNIYMEELSSGLDAIAKGAVDADEGIVELGKAFSTMLENAKRLGREGSAELVNFIIKTREMGLSIKEVDEYVFGWLDKATGGLKAMVEATDGTAESLNNLGHLSLATFNAMIAQGRGLGEALDAIKEPVLALKEKYAELGMTGDAATQQLFKMVGIREEHKTLFDAIDGNKQVLEALGNTGFLTGAALENVADNAKQYYERLQAAGMTSHEALASIAPTLSKLQYYADQYGIAIDNSTQSLIDQADQAGLLGDQYKTETQIMSEGFDKVNESIQNLIYVMSGGTHGLAPGAGSGTLPDAAQKMTDAVCRAASEVSKVFGDELPEEAKKIGDTILDQAKDVAIASELMIGELSDVERRIREGRWTVPIDFKTEGIVPEAQYGMQKVPATQLVRVHRGESILPEEISEALRSFFSGAKEDLGIGVEAKGKGLAMVHIHMDGQLFYKAIVPYLREGGDYADYEVSGEGVY